MVEGDQCSSGAEEVSSSAHDVKSQHAPAHVRRRTLTRANNSSDVRPETSVIEKENAPMDAAPGVSTDSVVKGTKESEEKKTGKGWSLDEINTYFDAVKQVGKDFDAIVRFMKKKKNSHKNKDQVRNYFFNCVKFVRSVTHFDIDTLFPDLCRDARELFLVINAGEWRKRTGGSKYIQEKMHEMLLDGYTCIKWNKKNLILRTPCCPALQKFFGERRMFQADKVASDVVILLSPATHSDRNYVISCEQNPNIAIRISTNDRISRIFELLRKKWNCRLLRDRKTITLFPSRHTEIGEVVVAEVTPDTEQVCLNRLKAEMDRCREKNSKKDMSIPNNTLTTYTTVIPRPFSFDEKLLISGLTLDNVCDASVAELYCMCGMTSEFKMVYSIESSRKKIESWTVFKELVKREFGDQAGAKDEEPRAPAGAEAKRKQPEIIDNSLKRIRIDGGSSRIIANKKPRLTVSSAKVVENQVTVIPRVIESEVVVAENNAFITQLKDLKEKTASAKAARKKGSKSKIATEDLIPAAGAMGTFYPPLSAPQTSQAQVYYAQSEPIDFSQMASCSSDQKPVYVNVEQQESSLLYAELTPYNGNTMDNDLFASPVLPRGTIAEQELENQRALDRLFGGDLSCTPVKNLGNNSLCSSDSIQKMAHSTMNEMMSQNSNDVYDRFQPLLDHMDNNDSRNPWPSNL